MEKLPKSWYGTESIFELHEEQSSINGEMYLFFYILSVPDKMESAQSTHLINELMDRTGKKGIIYKRLEKETGKEKLDEILSFINLYYQEQNEEALNEKKKTFLETSFAKAARMIEKLNKIKKKEIQDPIAYAQSIWNMDIWASLIPVSIILSENSSFQNLSSYSSFLEKAIQDLQLHQEKITPLRIYAANLFSDISLTPSHVVSFGVWQADINWKIACERRSGLQALIDLFQATSLDSEIKFIQKEIIPSLDLQLNSFSKKVKGKGIPIGMSTTHSWWYS